MGKRTLVSTGWSLLLVAPLLVAACGDDDSPTNGGGQGDGGSDGSGGESPSAGGGDSQPEATVIGPKGGVVVSDDGLLELTIPAGALEEATPISITALAADEASLSLDDATLLGAYRFEPDGTEFAEPATFAYTVEDFVIGDEDATLPMVLVTTESDGELEGIDQQSLDVNLDTNAATLSGPLSHFSQMVFNSLGPGLDTAWFYVAIEPRPPKEAELGTDYGVGLFVHTKSALASESVLTYDDESDNLEYSEGADPYEIAAFGSNGEEPGRDIVPVGTYRCMAAGDATFSVRLTTGLLEFPPFQAMLGHGNSSNDQPKAVAVLPPPSVYDITITSQLTCNQGTGPEPLAGPPYSGIIDYNAVYQEEAFVESTLLGVDMQGSFYSGGAAQADFDAWVATRQRMLGITEDRPASGTCREISQADIILGEAPAPAGTTTQVGVGADNRLAFAFPDTQQTEPVFLDWVAPLRGYRAVAQPPAAPEPSTSGVDVFVPAGAATPAITLPGWDSETWESPASVRGEDGLEVTWDADLLQADYVHALIFGYSEAGSKYFECFAEVADQQLLIPQQVLDDAYVPPLGEEQYAHEAHIYSGRRTSVAYDGRTLEGLIRRDTQLLY